MVASKQKSDKRYAICRACPLFNDWTTQCKVCKCFMRVKTKIEKAYCPKGKW